MKPKFQIGEKVIVNEIGLLYGERANKLWDYFWWKDVMNEYIGKTCTIKSIYGGSFEPTYHLEESKLGFQECWLSKHISLPDELFEI